MFPLILANRPRPRQPQEKGEIWWEEGNEGAKLGPLLAKRKKEREEADKHLRGVPLKELKAMKKAEKARGAAAAMRRW